MEQYCIRKELESRLPTDDKFTLALILLCCDYCKKMDEHQEIDKYNKLFVEPIIISMRKDENALMRAIGSLLLDKTAALFPPSKNEQNEIEAIYNSVKKTIHDHNNRELIKCLSGISPNTYLKLMAKWHSDGIYDAAFATSLCFLNAKTDIVYQAFQTQFYYSENNTLFFDIGVSLNEGITENMTIEVAGAPLGEAYYFEVEFYRKLKEKLIMTKEEEVQVMFHNQGMHFIYNRSSNNDKCSFYQLFKLADCQCWKEANQILKTIMEGNSHGND